MKIAKFSHLILYSDNMFQHIEVTLETTDKIYTLKGVKVPVYTNPLGDTFNTPAQVFYQLAIVQSLGLPCTFTTDEPAMFNLESIIHWTRADGDHKIVFNYHILEEKTKGE